MKMFKSINLIIRTKRFIVYNLIMWPVICIVYTPYNLLILHYTATQAVAWIKTSLPWGIAANIILLPIVQRAIKLVERIN